MRYARFHDVFQTMRYPAGESHVALRSAVDPAQLATIEASVRGFEELCNVLTADRILAHQRVRARWFIPYFPFARHDRRIDARDGLELELALELVRGLDLTIADPHSDVAGCLRHLPQKESVRCFEAAGAFEGDPLVVIPDAGATKKALSWCGVRETLQCAKRRDPCSGVLSGFAVPCEDLAGRPCIIVDDLCDGGGTFLGLARELAAKGAGRLTLAVTHGLFSQGLEALAKHFARIFAFGSEALEQGSLRVLPYRTLYTEGECV